MITFTRLDFVGLMPDTLIKIVARVTCENNVDILYLILDNCTIAESRNVYKNKLLDIKIKHNR